MAALRSPPPPVRSHLILGTIVAANRLVSSDQPLSLSMRLPTAALKHKPDYVPNHNCPESCPSREALEKAEAGLTQATPNGRGQAALQPWQQPDCITDTSIIR